MLSLDQAAAVLGLRRPCTPDQIKRAYRQKSKETHPDHGGTAKAFKRVMSAKELLEEDLAKDLEEDLVKPVKPRSNKRPAHGHRSHRSSTPPPRSNPGSARRRPGWGYRANEGPRRTHSHYRNYDPFDPFWYQDVDEDEEGDDYEKEKEEILGAWYDVLSVTSGGIRIDHVTQCRAQLVIIGNEYLIAVYLAGPQRIETEEVTVVLSEEGDPTPNTFTRRILQRSYSADGLTSAFWFSPLRKEGANRVND